MEISRATEAEKQSQLARVHDVQEERGEAAAEDLDRLKRAPVAGENVFAVIIGVARVASLGQITRAFEEVGGLYRRRL